MPTNITLRDDPKYSGAPVAGEIGHAPPAISSALERAARALCRKALQDEAANLLAEGAADVSALVAATEGGVAHHWQRFVPEVRAVLTAIRDPDEAMLKAGEQQMHDGAGPEHVYTAMIGTILAEKP